MLFKSHRLIVSSDLLQVQNYVIPKFWNLNIFNLLWTVLSNKAHFFSLVKTRSRVATQHAILIFSRAYLYSYVCFFIYVVLSLCICIIEDAYTVVSNYRSDSCPWLQDRGLLPEFATSWEQNLLRRRKSTDANSINRHVPK